MFKETRRWPGTRDFKNRKKFAAIDKAVKQFHHVKLEELFSGWVSEQVFVGQVFRKSRLVFTGDIRIKEPRDTYTLLMKSLKGV